MRAPRRLLTAVAAVAWATGLVLGTGLAVPRVAVACSCMAPQPLAAYEGPENVILAGEVLGRDDPGIRVGVEQWFAGTDPAPVVRIAADFGNGASCGVGSVPAEGSRWIWVLWRPADEGVLGELGANENLQTNICQPYASLDTPEGQALLEEAVATFGDGAAVPGESAAPVTAPPQAPAEPTPTVEAAPSGPPAESVALAAVGGVIALGVLVLVVVAVIGRRRPAGS
jgi:hypothetical protein